MLTALLAVCALLVALPAAASAAPDDPPVVPQLAFEPGSYDFGLQEVNRSNAQAWFQLRNNGSSSAQVYYTEITGSSSFWTGYNDCGGRNLGPGETCSVQVVFGPQDVTSYEAELRAYSEEGTVFAAELSGEGGRAMLVPSTDPTNFGSVAVGSSVVKTIDLTNRGNLPGGVFIAVIAGGAVGSFQLLDENCSGVMIQPGSSCNLQVRFAPLSSGSKTARLGLFGDSDANAQLILSGVGFDPVVGPPSTAGEPSPALAPPAAKKHRKKRRARGKGHRRGNAHRAKRHRRPSLDSHRPLR